jgi:PIN domain
MLRLLIDTSTLLDLAKRRDGQKWIVSLRMFAHQAKLELLVPTVVIDEFKRNRARVETSVTASVSERFRLIKRDLDEYGGEDQQHALDVLEGLAHQVPLIGAMTTRNFEDILSLLESGQSIEPTGQQRVRVVQRGLEKSAPFHRSRNSVADAVLIELYASAIDAADLRSDPHAIITSNSEDFSSPQGDKWGPHRRHRWARRQDRHGGQPLHRGGRSPRSARSSPVRGSPAGCRPSVYPMSSRCSDQLTSSATHSACKPSTFRCGLTVH